MLNFLPAFIRATIAAFLYLISTIFWALATFVLALITYIVPLKSWRQCWQHHLHSVPDYWNDTNEMITKLTTKVVWDIQGVENLEPKTWYLLLSNHQSWIDIIVLHIVLKHKIPSLRFFMKRELLWQFPIASQACLLLGYPFMQRYSKDYLKKHPELKGKDFENTKKSCEKYKNIPITMTNFVEGHRFTQARHDKQESPYQYLLKPRAAGAAYTLMMMGEYLKTILDVTIVYPKNKNLNLWDFFCGRISPIIIRVKALPITKDLLGDYENDRNYKIFFQNWLNQLWQEKDRLIGEIKKHYE
ncbi:MAG: acyltransferase [Gammaproteobacteria bacterium]